MRTKPITGHIRGTRSGFAFLIREDGGEDLFISQLRLNGAVHGDRVSVTLRAPPARLDFRAEAQVDSILERPHPNFTGDVVREGRSYHVRPDSPLLPERLSLHLDDTSGIAGGKILFRVENSIRRDHAPYAVLVERIGEAGDATLDPIIIASEFGLRTRFPDDAIEEGNRAGSSGASIPGDADRKDYREELVLTIDPCDAKDFDDAVGLERRRDGGFQLTVHIADVTAFVAEGGPLDREARERGTSVYFPGSVFPMLPESISTVAASLSPESDKRTLSVEIGFDSQGGVQETQVHRGWIRSTARLHYEQAQAILDGREETEESIERTLFRMKEFASILRSRRFAKGGFELDVPEAEIRLGADGVPDRVFRRVHLASHWLIEEFMIAANRAVGAWALERELPFLFRIHEPPDPRAIESFRETVRALKPSTPAARLETMPALRRWLGRLPGTPLSRILQRYFLRSLRKAVYSPDDLGHFGLGIEGYCHFTSPIRRYPDLFNHRRIIQLLERKSTEISHEELEEIARESTRLEATSEESEREMIQLKATRYMERRLGKESPGHVSGVTPRGLFVELDRIPIDGFVPRQQLGAHADFVEDSMAWVFDRGRRRLRPGDAVRIQVVRADLRLRRIEFALLADPGSFSGRRGQTQETASRSRKRGRGEKKPRSHRSSPGRSSRTPRKGGRSGKRR